MSGIGTVGIGLGCFAAVHPLQRHVCIAVPSVAKQFYSPAAVFRSDLVLTREFLGDAQQARRAKVDVCVAPVAELSSHNLSEFRLMVFQPSEIVQPLIDDVLILSTLVLDDNGPTGSVDAQRVDTPAVARASRMLRGEEFNSGQGAQVLLEELL